MTNTAASLVNNPECPDYCSHEQNAADRLFPGADRLSPEQSEAVDTEAAAEYRACEGH